MRNAWAWAVALSMVGCATEEPVTEAGPGTWDDPAEEEESLEVQRDAVCDSLADEAESLGSSADACVPVIVEDCERIVDTFSPTLVHTIATCVEGGASPWDCLASGLLELRPTPAHLELAAAFCEACAFDAPYCEEVFYFGDDGNVGVGMFALPLSDEVVREITETCVDGLTCGATFAGCVRDVLEARLVPQDSFDCVMEGRP
jgi:hypothetical protein